MKNWIIFLIGAVGGTITTALGGWDYAIYSLIILMAIDYLTGFITGLVNKSAKTETGGLSSAVGWKGLAKKVLTLLLVVVANILDKQIGIDYIRDMVCISFSVNEALSIIENAGTLGVPIPKAMLKAIDMLKQKGEPEDDEK